MGKKGIRIIAALLAGMMVLSVVAAVVFAQEEPVFLTLEKVEGVGIEKPSGKSTVYEDDDVISVIVELEDAPVLEESVNSDISKSKSVKKLESAQDKLVSAINEKTQAQVKYSFTMAMNAVVLSLPYGMLDEVAAMENVKNIYIDEKHTVTFPKTENAVDMTGVSMINAAGSSSYGISTAIGIIDTGIDMDHEAFSVMPRLAKFKQEDIKELLDSNDFNAEKAVSSLTADDVYYSAKLPFVFDYAQGDSDVNHKDGDKKISDHGTHVAAIAAGYAAEEDGGLIFSGVAPYAQLAIFKVFGIDENGETFCEISDVIAALEDAVLLGLDVVNMSMGWNGGLTSHDGNTELEPFDRMIERLENAGLTLVCAAGNEATAGLGNTSGTDMNTLVNIDNGALAAPSTYDGVISVGSINNSKRLMPVFRASVDGEPMNVSYTEAMDSTVEFASLARSEEYEYVYCGFGSTSELRSESLSGKIALIQRGDDITFEEKIKNAAAKGAVGVIIYNNEEGAMDSFSVLSANAVPSVFITMADGEKLAANTGEKKIKVLEKEMYTSYEGGFEMTDRSSWGTTSELTLKPDVVAPGGNIYSALDENISGRKYGVASGTSMASPHIAGIIALLKTQYSSTLPKMTQKEFSDLVRSQLISTAQPIKDSRGVYYSPRRQGAGVADAYSAGLARLEISVPGNSLPKAELGDDSERKGVYTIEFSVKNSTDESASFNIETTVLTETMHNEQYISGKASDITKFADIDAGGTLTLSAGETKTVRVKVTLSDTIKQQLNEYPSGVYIDGFVRLVSTDVQNGYAYTVPYLAFYGDWDEAPMFEETNYMEMLEKGENAGTVSTQYANAAITTIDGAPDTVYYVGQNPVWGEKATYRRQYNAISPDGDGYYDTLEIYYNLMRSAESVTLTIADSNTGTVYYTDTNYGAPKVLYSQLDGMIVPASYFEDNEKEAWAGTDMNGRTLANGTQCTVTLQAKLAREGYNSANNACDTFSFPLTIDTQAPEVVYAKLEEKDGRKEIVLAVKDDCYVADILLCDTSASKKEIQRFMVSESIKNMQTTVRADVSKNYEDMYIVVTDYAWNQTVYRISPADSVKIDQKTPYVRMGEEITLDATMYSSVGYGYSEEITWSSADESVARIDEKTGVVTPVSIGTVKITAEAASIGASDSVTLTVLDESAIIPGMDTITLKGTSTYTLDDDYVRNVMAQTTVEQFLANFENGGALRVVDKNGADKTGNDRVGTGDRVVYTENGTDKESRTVVISGDLTGDGMINSRDVAALQKMVMQTQVLTGAYALAADTEPDGRINSRDIAKLQRTILG